MLPKQSYVVSARKLYGLRTISVESLLKLRDDCKEIVGSPCSLHTIYQYQSIESTFKIARWSYRYTYAVARTTYNAWKSHGKSKTTRMLRVAICPPPPQKKLNCKNQESPLPPVKFVKSKWQYNMINYIWWLTIPQILNEIRWAVSEELRPQSVPIV